MTENLERYVLQALQKKVIAVIGESIPVKYVGRNMKPPSNNKWWEVVYIPSNVENEFWGNGKTYQGMLRLVLHWPQDDTGVYDAMDEVKRVSDGFLKGQRITDPDETVNVSIIDHPNTMNIIEESPQLLIPLTVRYSCFTI